MIRDGGRRGHLPIHEGTRRTRREEGRPEAGCSMLDVGDAEARHLSIHEGTRRTRREEGRPEAGRSMLDVESQGSVAFGGALGEEGIEQDASELLAAKGDGGDAPVDTAASDGAALGLGAEAVGGGPGLV